jgi:hypothetical protein
MAKQYNVVFALVLGVACAPGERLSPCNDDTECALEESCTVGVCTRGPFSGRGPSRLDGNAPSATDAGGGEIQTIDKEEEEEEAHDGADGDASDTLDPERPDPDEDAGPAVDEEVDEEVDAGPADLELPGPEDAGPGDDAGVDAGVDAGPFEDGGPGEGPFVENLVPESRLGMTLLNDSDSVTCEEVFDIAPPVGDVPGVLRCTHTQSRPGYFRRGAIVELRNDKTYTLSFFFKNHDVDSPYGRNAVNMGLLATTYFPYEEHRGSLTSATDVGNGWYRQSLTFEPAYTQSYGVNFNQSVEQAPVGTYYLFGFQLEVAASAGPYTPN